MFISQPRQRSLGKKEHISFTSTMKEKPTNLETVQTTLKEYRIHNADVVLREEGHHLG